MCCAVRCAAVTSAVLTNAARVLPSLPACVQFRLNGAKGIFYRDSSLPGMAVQLRDSQRKFWVDNPTKEQMQIEVLAALAVPCCAVLCAL